MKSFIFLAFSNFFFFISQSFFYLFPVYLNNLGASKGYIGIIMGTTTGVLVLFTFFMRDKIDYLNKKRILVITAFLSVILYLLFYIRADLYTIPILRTLQGIVYAIGFTVTTAVAVDLIPANKRTGLLGIFGVSGGLTNGLGTFIADRLVYYFNFKAIFIAAGICSLCWLIFISFVNYKKPQKANKAKAEEKVYIKEYKKVLILAILFGSIFSSFFAFMSHYSEELSVTPSYFYFLAYTISLISIRIFFLKKLNSWSSSFIVMLGFSFGLTALFAAFFLKYMAFSLILLLIGVFYGTAHGFLYPKLTALFIETTPHRSGKATFMCLLCFSLGNTISAFIYGFIAEFIGYSLMYLVAASVVIVVGAAYIKHYQINLKTALKK